MSNKKREKKVIHVDKLVIHAKDVELIQENHVPPETEKPEVQEREERHPWDFFWRGQQRAQETPEVTSDNIPEEQKE